MTRNFVMSCMLGTFLVSIVLGQEAESPDVMLGAALHQQDVEGDLESAVAAYERILALPNVPRQIAARALLQLGIACEALGLARAQDAYERLIREFEDQPAHVAQAQAVKGQHIAGPAFHCLRAPDEDRPDARDIYVMAADLSFEVAFVQDSADDSGPVWTPDGKGLLFVSNRGGSNDLWVQSVEYDQPIGAPRLVKSESGAVSPIGSTDAGDLYYQVTKSNSSVHFARFDAAEGSLSRIDLPSIGRPGFQLSRPTWSVDGRRLAYVAGDRLIVRELDSGDADSSRRLLRDDRRHSPLSRWDEARGGNRRRKGRNRRAVPQHWRDMHDGSIQTLEEVIAFLRSLSGVIQD